MRKQILHMVIFQLAKEVTQDRIDRVTNMFLECLGPCPGLLAVNFGKNVSTSKFSKGWTLAVVLTFEDIKARDIYLPHHLHKRISEEVSKDFFDDLVVFDLEIKRELSNPKLRSNKGTG